MVIRGEGVAKGRLLRKMKNALLWSGCWGGEDEGETAGERKLGKVW